MCLPWVRSLPCYPSHGIQGPLRSLRWQSAADKTVLSQDLLSFWSEDKHGKSLCWYRGTEPYIRTEYGIEPCLRGDDHVRLGESTQLVTNECGDRATLPGTHQECGVLHIGRSKHVDHLTTLNALPQTDTPFLRPRHDGWSWPDCDTRKSILHTAAPLMNRSCGHSGKTLAHPQYEMR
jgi:hypothetical protein